MYGVKNTEYVDLQEFINEDMQDYFDEALRFSSSDDWKEQFFAIDTMRRLNKFSPEILEQRIMEAFKFITEWIHSPRTFLGRNTLVLIQEIYMKPRNEVMIEFTRSIIPIVWIKTAHESSFINNESRTALQFLAASAAFPECIEELCIQSESKSTKVKTYVWQALTISIQNFETDPSLKITSLSQPVSYFLKQPEKFEILFKTLFMGLTAAKSIEEKESKKILKWIGKDVVKQMCIHLFDEDNKHKTKRIMMVFDAKPKQNKAGSFKKFLLKKKKKISGSTWVEPEIKELAIIIN